MCAEVYSAQQEAPQLNNEQAQGAVSAIGLNTHTMRKKNRHHRGKKCSKKKNGWLNKRRNRLKKRRLMRRRLLKAQAEKTLPSQAPSIVLSWPLERNKFWKSSLFGYRKNGYGVWKFHTGLDLAAPRHTPVHAAADGVAAEVRFDSGGYGNMVLLQHSDGTKTRYAHLHRFKVRPNQRVKKGQLIGTVGATGNVRGNGTDKSHLHFEILVNGKPRNPLRYLH